MTYPAATHPPHNDLHDQHDRQPCNHVTANSPTLCKANSEGHRRAMPFSALNISIRKLPHYPFQYYILVSYLTVRWNIMKCVPWSPIVTSRKETLLLGTGHFRYACPSVKRQLPDSAC
jgi:hypothetical protein